MISAKRHEFRAADRDSRFSREFSLQLLTHDQSGRVVPIRPLDVSGRGLGFMVKEHLRMGSIYTLVIGTNRFRVEVAYCNPDGNLQIACEHTGLLAADSNGGSVVP